MPGKTRQPFSAFLYYQEPHGRELGSLFRIPIPARKLPELVVDRHPPQSSVRGRADRWAMVIFVRAIASQVSQE